MRTETIDLGPMPVYVAHPDEQPSRAVIVIQEAFGVNHHVEDVTRRVADAGYLGVAPHIFHRSGGGTISYGDREGIMKHFAALKDEDVLADVDAVRAFLKEQGIDDASTGVVGFCIGGRMSFLVAAERVLGAGVTFYGGGIVPGRGPNMPPLLDKAAAMRTPWLGLFGDTDQSIPVEEVEQLRDATRAAGVDSEVVRYEHAGHGFHCDARPDAYDEEAAKDAWARTLDWFERHLA